MKFLNIIQLEGFWIDPTQRRGFSSTFLLLIKAKQKKSNYNSPIQFNLVFLCWPPNWDAPMAATSCRVLSAGDIQGQTEVTKRQSSTSQTTHEWWIALITP